MRTTVRTTARFMSVATAVTAAAVLTACGTADPYGANNYPAASPPAASYPSSPNQPVAYVEYGRITQVEVLNSGAPANQGTAGTIIGGVAGAVIGNQIGSGGGRAAATVLGALGGAVVGNRVDRSRNPATAGAVYRITLQTDGGAWRTYDVGGTDLRVGERVRVENGQIYRA